MINAGKYKHRITIYSISITEDEGGFRQETRTQVLSTYAEVKTMRGYTLITSNTDFDKAYVNFTIRYPKTIITRDMIIEYKGKTYTIEYLNDKDIDNVELEIQAKEVTK